MASPFHTVAESYRARGYSVVPLLARSKRIILRDWTQYCDSAASDDVFKSWLSMPESNIGLCLGEASGLLAIDYDIDVNGLHKRISDLLPKSPCIKRGAKGWTAFYKYSGERSASYKAEHVGVLDVLGAGRQTVLPPSIHPDGMEYRWDGPSLLECGELPAIPAQAMAEVIRLFKGTQEPRRYERQAFDFTAGDDVEQALSYIGADDYDTWIRVGMALKDGGHSYTLWDKWSATSAKYPGAVTTRKKWDGFNGAGIHIETMFYESIQGGYKPEPKPLPAMVKIEQGGNLRMAEESNDIPGLPGLIAEHINASAGYKQPVLAMGAAIALAAAIAGGRVKTETGITPNVYCLGIGPSASGKDHPFEVIDRILIATNQRGLRIGAPKSGSGLIKAMSRNHGVALCMMDEFAHFIAAITQKNAGKYFVEIAQQWLMMYNGRAAIGDEFADHDGKMPRIDLDQTCLSMYTATTPDKFYASVTSETATEGLLSRFMLFETNDFPTVWEAQRGVDDMPSELLDAIEQWKTRGLSGNLPGAYEAEVIPCTLGAEEMLSAYTIESRESAKRMLTQGDAASSIMARRGHNARKLALIAHEGGVIDERVAAWAMRIAENNAAHMLGAMRERIGDSERDIIAKKILAFVKKEQQVTQSVLTRRFQRIDSRLRKEIIHDLMESEQLSFGENEGKGGKKQKVFFCD